MTRFLCVAVLVLCSAALPLSAQSCIALPGQSRASVRVGIASPDGSSQLSARAGAFVGRFFGGVSGQYAKVGPFDGSIRTGGADVGVELPINRAKTVMLCPTIGIAATRLRISYGDVFEELALDEELSGRQLVAALNLGGTVVVSPTVDLLPFGSVGLSTERVTNTGADPTNPFAFAGEPSESNTTGLVGVGLGLQFSKRYVIAASLLQRVVSNFGGDALITVSGAIGFGSR